MQNLMLSWQSAGALGGGLYGASLLTRRTGRSGAALLLREAATVLGLFAVWQLAGELSVMGTDGAVARGRWLWDTERSLGLPDERALQQAVLGHPLLVQAANYYYATLHFGAVIALLLWVFLRHRERYPWVRATLVLVTAASLLVQLVPVAPPRLVPGIGMLDTAEWYGQSVYAAGVGGVQADAYSAMPSVHIAWSVLVAVAVVRIAPGRLRWAAVAHPVLTLAVVLLTANHFWLDGAAAVALLLLAYLAQWGAARAAAHLRARRSGARPEPAPAEPAPEPTLDRS